MAASCDTVNQARAAIGLAPVDSMGTLLDRAERVVVTSPAELDAPVDGIPGNVRYVGPVFEPAAIRRRLDAAPGRRPPRGRQPRDHPDGRGARAAGDPRRPGAAHRSGCSSCAATTWPRTICACLPTRPGRATCATARCCPTPTSSSTTPGWAPCWPRWPTGSRSCASRSAATNRPTPPPSPGPAPGSCGSRARAPDELGAAALDALADRSMRARAEELALAIGGPGAGDRAVAELDALVTA